MTSKLFRWAKPHKGPVSHLTLFEYILRVAVFYPIAVALFLPTLALILFMAFGGLWAIVVTVAELSGPNYPGLPTEDKIFFAALALLWLASLVFSMFIRDRFLTPR